MSNVALLSRSVLTDQEAWAVWEMEMRAAGCRPRTIKTRFFTFWALQRFLGKAVIEASRVDLMRWLGREELSPKTRQNYKSFAHTLYTLLQDEGHRADNPAARLPRTRVVRQEANPPSTDEVQRLLSSGIYGRTRMMILLACYQGFRAAEIAAIAGENIDWEARRIFIVDAKGGKEVWRPIHEAVWEHAIAHPQRFPREGFWFPGGVMRSDPTRRQPHVLANNVSRVVSDAMQRAGLIGHRPHQLRAWHATELTHAGVDQATVQHSMRHASADTLKYYVRHSETLLMEGMSRLPQLDVPESVSRGQNGGGRRKAAWKPNRGVEQRSELQAVES